MLVHLYLFHLQSVSTNGTMMSQDYLQASKNPAILVEPQLIKLTEFISSAYKAFHSNSVLLGLVLKYFNTVCKFSLRQVASSCF